MKKSDSEPWPGPTAHPAVIIEALADAIISKDLDGMITSWNPAAETLFGWSRREAIGQSIAIIFPEERWAEETQILERIRDGQVLHHYETVRKRKDGTLIDVSLTLSPIKDPTGNPIGAAKIARDITNLKQSETQFRDFRRGAIRHRDRRSAGENRHRQLRD